MSLFNMFCPELIVETLGDNVMKSPFFCMCVCIFFLKTSFSGGSSSLRQLLFVLLHSRKGSFEGVPLESLSGWLVFVIKLVVQTTSAVFYELQKKNLITFDHLIISVVESDVPQ